jgi:hypothetical protein
MSVPAGQDQVPGLAEALKGYERPKKEVKAE